MKCVKCGTELASGFKFCPNCGAHVEAPAVKAPVEPETMHIQPTRMPRLINVQGGIFVMGTNELSHKVSLVSFSLAETPVTQAQYELVMGRNPSKLVGPNRPVESVNWCEAIIFCNTLSMMQNLQPCYNIGNTFDLHTFESTSPVWKRITCNFTANGYRLPTEAEWEFAARGGHDQYAYPFAGSPDINKVAWYGENSNVSTHDVSTKMANTIGLYDMCGNVSEWCWDYMEELGVNPQTNPHGPQTGSMHIKRGGSWLDDPQQCTVYFRSGSTPTGKSSSLGFRVARSLVENIM